MLNRPFNYFCFLVILIGSSAVYALEENKSICSDVYTHQYDVAKGATSANEFVIETDCPKSQNCQPQQTPKLLNLIDKFKITDTQVAQDKPIETPPINNADHQASAPRDDSMIILFDLNSSVIWPKTRNQIVKFARSHPGASVTVDGYGCWLGSDGYNVWLSNRRAVKVAKVLTANGIHVLSTNANGKADLIDTGIPSPNRRVNVQIKGGDASAGKKEINTGFPVSSPDQNNNSNQIQ